MAQSGVSVEDNISESAGAGGVPRKRVRVKKSEMAVQHQRESATASHIADTTKTSIEAAIAALPIGLGVWVASRLEAKLDFVRLSSKSVIFPGIKFWLSNEMGLGAGPIIAILLPSNLHDNGIVLAVKYKNQLDPRSAGYPGSLSASEAKDVAADVAGEGWYTAAFVPVDDQVAFPGYVHLDGLRFALPTKFLIVAAFVGTLSILPKIAEALISKVIP